MTVYTVDIFHLCRFHRRVALEAPGPLSALSQALDLPHPLKLTKVHYHNGRLCAALPESTVNFVVDTATV